MTHDAPRRGPMPRWLRAIGWIAGLGVTAALCAVGALAMCVLHVAEAMPSYSAMKVQPTGRTVRILAADGSLLQTLGPAYGEWLPADRIPDVMKRAMISVEDRRFAEHHGVDPRALARVAWFAWRHRGDGRRLQGASTITQQAARTVFLDRSYDVTRKIREMIIALAMERRLDKARVLELYLNRVYLGGGAYGIDAASRRFFGHPATRLTLSEASLLAGLAKAPSDLSPSADASAAFARQAVVLGTMVDTGAITRAQADAARADHPRFAADPQARGDNLAYFTDWVRPQIDALVGDDPARGVDVLTTVDPRLQALASTAIARETPRVAQAALVSIDRDGAVRALVGGRDHAASPFNRATQATRQPGSAFKLFVYLAALEKGMTPGSSVVDAPVTIGDWSPRNAIGGYVGSTSLANAFAQSINTVAARLGRSVGTDRIAAMARRLGVTTPVNTDPAMVLGSSETRLVDMTRAYADVAAGGVAIAPYGVVRISSAGRVIYRRRAEARLVMSPAMARDVTAMLQNNVENGTGSAAAIGRPAAGKTGTTTSGRDGWFMGFSSGLTTGVWVGRDDAKPIPSLQGGRAPARAWASFMRAATKDRKPDERVPLPSGGGGARPVHADDSGTPPAGGGGRGEDGEATSDDADDDAVVIPTPWGGRGEAPVVIRRGPEAGRSRAIPMGED